MEWSPKRIFLKRNLKFLLRKSVAISKLACFSKKGVRSYFVLALVHVFYYTSLLNGIWLLVLLQHYWISILSCSSLKRKLTPNMPEFLHKVLIAKTLQLPLFKLYLLRPNQDYV